jgi:cytoskeletal protein RodZ
VDDKESLGKYLKREREIRNISLREVANHTRVREYLLKAIEEDQFHLLPSGTYVKGFLSTYAKYIGLDPNDVILRYESVLKGEPFSRPPAACEPADRPEVPPERKMLWDRKHLWIVGGVLVVIVIASYLLYSSRPSIQPVPVKPTVEEPPPAPPSPNIAGTTTLPEEKAFSLQLKAVEKTWVRIQVNGQPEHEMTLKSGEATSHRALKRIDLMVGNAGGLDLIFNGRPLERFGKSGEVVHLIFTSQGAEVKRPEKPKPP